MQQVKPAIAGRFNSEILALTWLSLGFIYSARADQLDRLLRSDAIVTPSAIRLIRLSRGLGILDNRLSKWDCYQQTR